MFSNVSSYQESLNCDDRTMEVPDLGTYTINVCIPKVEPCYPSTCDSNEDLSYDGLMKSPIPFTAPYKVKDPIVLLERCDKIWETLQLIKNVQSTNSDSAIYNDRIETQTAEVSENLNTLPPCEINSGPSYIKYQPVLGNNNAALPNFSFSVKTTKKLFQCTTCGKQYIERRSLRYHSERVHGICMPPKRNRRSNTKLDEKKIEEGGNSEVIEKEKNNIEKLHMERNRKEHADVFQAAMTLAKEHETVNSTSRPQRKRKHSLVPDSNNIGTSEAHTKVQRSQTRSSTCSELILCILCKQLVKDIRKHLTDYHKIECTDIMLKELGQTLSSETPTTSKNKESEKTISSNNKPLQRKVNVITQKELHLSQSTNAASQDFQNIHKRKLSVSRTGSRKRHKLNNNDILNNKNMSQSSQSRDVVMKAYECDICLGRYASSRGLYKHKRYHRLRGETKENFHLFECNYLNSPLRSKQKTHVSSSNSVTESSLVPANSNNYMMDETKQTEEQAYNASNNHLERRSSKKTDWGLETTCSCGRSFRNPHTLFVHKANCKQQNDGETQLVTRNSSDRDSGIGINITIKKKNNSYEIVGRDSGDEDKSEDFSSPKDSDALSDMSDYISEDYNNAQKSQQHEMLESSKYSKHHSILKLQSVDEDIDVDIEEDSQNNFGNDNTNDSHTTNELQNDSHEEEKRQEMGLEQDVPYREVPSLRFLCKKVVAKYKQKKHSSVMNCAETPKLCVCGKTFQTKRALDLHVSQSHPALLTCGYCQENFMDLDACNDHQCTIEQGKKFIVPKVQICCYHCNIALNTKRDFDEHMKRKHYNPMVPFNCHKCPKRFCSFKKWQAHYQTEHSTVLCSVCNIKCHVNARVKHQGYHYGLGFPCHKCKKAYPSKQMLIGHTKTVIHQDVNMRKEPCNIRGRILRNEQSLEPHIKPARSAIRKIKCSSCGMPFMSKRGLDLHITKGTCEKSFKTPVREGLVPES